jgi:UDP-N-acetylglucosamine--N-acetylmuramyl-(pentapeptide) pyrophosphoryl-undecaprenol N-acetylglucosamine transferase
VILAGHFMGKKTIIHEQNAVPGLTNRVLSRFVDLVALSFPTTAAHFPKAKKLAVTGNPRASEVAAVDSKRVEALRQELGLEPGKKCVVVMSGSRGARPINEAVLTILPDVAEQDRFQLVFSTGQIHYDSVMERLRRMGLDHSPQIIVRPFIYDMPALWRVTDVIVCRAGATTLAEMTSSGTPGVLIPSPYVTDNHQEHNARWLVDNGAAEMILEKDLTGERLFRTILDMVSSERRLHSMRKRSAELGLTNAVQAFTMQMRQLIGEI